MSTELEKQEISMSEEGQKALDAATTSEQIRSIMLEEAAKQGFIASPKTEASKAVDTVPVVIPKTPEDITVYEDDFVIGGHNYHFEGDSPADINRQVKAAMAAHEAATAKPVDSEAAPKAQDDLIAMQLDVQSGRMSIDEYIVKSGAVDKYLQSKGIKVDDLKEVVTEKRTNKEMASWKSATDKFLSQEGNDWPGGEQNMKVLGYHLASLNLTGKPSVESLQKAYDAMKKDNMVFPVTPVTPAPATPAPKKKLSSSATFGVGTGSNDASKPAITPNTGLPKITDDMSPRDIMEAYKAAVIAGGGHPDDYLRSGGH